MPPSAHPSSESASPCPYASAVSTVSMPRPGRRSPCSRASSIASPKRRNRPPLQLPIAFCPGWGTARTLAGRRGALARGSAALRTARAQAHHREVIEADLVAEARADGLPKRRELTPVDLPDRPAVVAGQILRLASRG